MSTGLFATTNGRIGRRGLSIAEREGKPRSHSRAGPSRATLAAERLETFAELLAEGASITDAAKAVGVNQQRGSAMLAQIRRELGAQAC